MRYYDDRANTATVLHMVKQFRPSPELLQLLAECEESYTRAVCAQARWNATLEEAKQRLDRAYKIKHVADRLLSKNSHPL